MRQITTQLLTTIVSMHEPPCISLYMPTHRHHPDNQQDPIRYQNLVKAAERSLRSKYSTRETRPLLEKFHDIAQDADFWNHSTDGLAVLASPGFFQTIELQQAVPEIAVVADSFHTKPLLHTLQAANRYQVLLLNRHQAKLYEGNRDVLDEVDLDAEVPDTIEKALGSELTEPHLTVASYGLGPAGARGVAMHHGHGQKKDEVDIDTDRFFRTVDRAILQHHSRPTGLPLMLAALPEHHDPFRQVSHNPLLMSEGIECDPQALSVEQLQAEAWQVMEPKYLRRLDDAADQFRRAQAKHLGSADLTDIAQAMVAGRVGTLLIEAQRQVAGKLDFATGRVEFGDQERPDLDDLLDAFAKFTLKLGGEVLVMPTERMSSQSSVAAIYRY